MSRLLFLTWMFPFVELFLMASGYARYLITHKRRMGTSGATEAIIQITTIGNYDSVNGIIAGVKAYDLPFPYQFWVVVEPGVENLYYGADEVIVVPQEFTTLAHYKARAQEYSRRVRAHRGLARRDVKVIMIDDDSLPTRQYFIDVFGADYDIVEGVVSPRRGYGRFLTHLDDVRTISCLTDCAFFQGFGHPLWVHGEGLTFRGSAEATVSWDYPVSASEDLTVGHNAVERGLSFGFVYSIVQITSPWSWSDFKKQRRRWTWGNISALKDGLLTPTATAMIVTRWLVGIGIVAIEIIALIALPFGLWSPPAADMQILLVSFFLWLSEFTLASWISSRDVDATLLDRLRNTLVGTLLAPITSAITTYVTLLNIVQGDPGGFEVIAKTKTPATVGAGK